MSILQINLFCSKTSRFPFTAKAVREIAKIKRRKDVCLHIHGEKHNADLWMQYFKDNKPDFNTQLAIYNNSSYLDKIRSAHNTSTPFSCKYDDDVLISSHVWDFIMDNLDKITDKTPIISPILTNGIPTVEFFVEDFCLPEENKIAKSLFLSGYVDPDIWGLNFSEVNTKIKSMTEWNGQEYWNFVSKVKTEWDTRDVPWYYFMVRGVHPARFTYEYNKFIADCIIKNQEKFFSKQNYYFDTYAAPYFTNNMFVSKTNYWRDTFKLFNDGWDEGQLTLKEKIDKSSILYIRNGFGIHMAYGMTNNQQDIEQYYINNII